jgi:hypothetical protein
VPCQFFNDGSDNEQERHRKNARREGKPVRNCKLRRAVPEQQRNGLRQQGDGISTRACCLKGRILYFIYPAFQAAERR